MKSLEQINRSIVRCRKCPELRTYCADVGRTKRRAYIDDDYWAKPVPGFGDQNARIWIMGLAPGAHGANRTGRMFTGDRSGDFLFAALHRVGLASQPEATHRDDGLQLRDVYISAGLRCAPPGNKPTAAQLNACRSYVFDDWRALSARVRVIVCLGGIAWNTTIALLKDLDVEMPTPRPKFGHGASWTFELDGRQRRLMGCYHVSQQNTFTGRLTPQMIDDVFADAIRKCDV